MLYEEFMGLPSMVYHAMLVVGLVLLGVCLFARRKVFLYSVLSGAIVGGCPALLLSISNELMLVAEYTTWTNVAHIVVTLATCALLYVWLSYKAIELINRKIECVHKKRLMQQ